MGFYVLKFGGTSVGTPERIRSVASKIQKYRKAGHRLVIVVSAMGQSTDELLDLAKQVSRNPLCREVDMLLTAGERVSMALLSMALADLKIDAISFTGSQSGIITDEGHQRARIQAIRPIRVEEALIRGQVAIVAGFQGVSSAREVTTLGRGGSDTTAVALAVALRADACEIYTDVDGIASADPRVLLGRGKGPKIWAELPSDLMVEYAARGAGVLHPRCVELARKNHLELCVKNSLNEESQGTKIMDRGAMSKEALESFQVVGVTGDEKKVLLRIELSRSTVVGALWDRIREANLPVLTPLMEGRRVTLFTDRALQAEWEKALGDLATDEFVERYEFQHAYAPLSVVGECFSQDASAVSAVLEPLIAERFELALVMASPLAVTVAIPYNRMEEGIRILHDKYF